MKLFICKSCGYKTRKENKPEKCNYCSKVGTMKEEEENAQDILDYN